MCVCTRACAKVCTHALVPSCGGISPRAELLTGLFFLQFHNKVTCFMLHQIEEPCSLGAHAAVIVPPTWIIKVKKPQVTAGTLVLLGQLREKGTAASCFSPLNEALGSYNLCSLLPTGPCLASQFIPLAHPCTAVGLSHGTSLFFLKKSEFHSRSACSPFRC